MVQFLQSIQKPDKDVRFLNSQISDPHCRFVFYHDTGKGGGELRGQFGSNLRDVIYEGSPILEINDLLFLRILMIGGLQKVQKTPL